MKDDLIRRQDAIEALEELIRAREEWITDSYGERQGINASICAVMDLPSAERGWIPVTEGLPKAGIRYQVTFESGEVGFSDFRNKMSLFDGSVKENVWVTEPYYEDDGEVIAWMELPQPWKGEDDAEVH